MALIFFNIGVSIMAFLLCMKFKDVIYAEMLRGRDRYEGVVIFADDLRRLDCDRVPMVVLLHVVAVAFT